MVSSSVTESFIFFLGGQTFIWGGGGGQEDGIAIFFPHHMAPRPTPLVAPMRVSYYCSLSHDMTTSACSVVYDQMRKYIYDVFITVTKMCCVHS